jgi:hypothetical protein
VKRLKKEFVAGQLSGERSQNLCFARPGGMNFSLQGLHDYSPCLRQLRHSAYRNAKVFFEIQRDPRNYLLPGETSEYTNIPDRVQPP